jgi:GT2 family glycosyltransferase/glycosyltransferase involved in cell wall biosynthesis
MRVLLVVHGFPPVALGGTETYSHALATRLRNQYGDDVAVLTREHRLDAPEYSLRDDRRDGLCIRWINNTFRETRTFEETYDNRTITALAADFIDEIRPDVAHIHHLTCLSTGIVFELRRRGIPIVLTLHDYWLLCHRGQLLNLHLQRCHGPLEDGCAACVGVAGHAGSATYVGARAMRALESRLPGSISRPLRRGAEKVAARLADNMSDPAMARLAHMCRVLGCVDQVLAPSRHMRDRFLPIVPAERIDVSEYGIARERFVAAHRSSPAEPGDGRSSRRQRPLRIGFLGSLMVSKAPHLLIDSFRRLPAGSATVTLVGGYSAYHGDDSYRAHLEPLFQTPGVTAIGAVAPDAIPEMLTSFDLLVVPSIWEENSPLVIREAFAAGVPVAAARIGGIPETVADGAGGLLFEPGDADDLARVLNRIVHEPDLLSRLRSSIPAVRDLDDDTRAARALYEKLATSDSVTDGPRPVPPSPTEHVAAVVLNYQTPDETLLAVRSLLASRRPFDDLIVVDNAADDALKTTLRDLLDRITFVSAGSNRGFSGGVNVGIREARRRGASHVLLVNSDVVLAPSALDALLSTFRDYPNAGIVAPVVLARSRPGTIATAGMTFADTTGRMSHPDAGRVFDASLVPTWKEAAGVSGCAMLIADKVFDRIGLLPEKYFFSFEDLAFCLSARDAGFMVGVCGAAVAYHEGSRTLGAASTRRLYFGTRNQLLLSAERPARGPAHRAIRACAVLVFNVLYALRAPGGLLGGRLVAVARGARDHARRRYGPD